MSPPERIEGGFTDLAVNEDQVLKSLKASQVCQSGVPDARMTQAEDLDVGEVAEERQVFVGHRRAIQGHNADIGLPNAVAAEHSMRSQAARSLRTFAKRAIWLLLDCSNPKITRPMTTMVIHRREVIRGSRMAPSSTVMGWQASIRVQALHNHSDVSP